MKRCNCCEGVGLCSACGGEYLITDNEGEVTVGLLPCPECEFGECPTCRGSGKVPGELCQYRVVRRHRNPAPLSSGISTLRILAYGPQHALELAKLHAFNSGQHIESVELVKPRAGVMFGKAGEWTKTN